MLNCFEFRPEDVCGATVKAYLQEIWKSSTLLDRPLPAIVICPGGAYTDISDKEAYPIAREYLAAGYQVFTISYSVRPNAKNFEPLCQLAATVSHIRKNAELWRIDPQKIAVCGFSAGGHLAASLGTLYNTEKFLSVWNRADDIRPNAMVLCYPVILAEEFAHNFSISNVSGAEPGTDEFRWFGLDNHVDGATPPTFLFHTAADTSVPVENSLFFAAALSKVKVPFELHVFPEGRHGIAACTHEVGTFDPYNRRWIDLSIKWLNKLFDFQL